MNIDTKGLSRAHENEIEDYIKKIINYDPINFVPKNVGLV